MVLGFLAFELAPCHRHTLFYCALQIRSFSVLLLFGFLFFNKF